MKKTFYIILLSVVTSICVTSCTEEEVKPSKTYVSTQGKESDPK